ncbi:MAG: hypothetical protein ABI412_03715 [Sphingomicrobium sp.]
MGEKMDRRAVIGGGALLVGAGAMVAPGGAGAQAASGYVPATEANDAWYAKGAHRHRMVFDTASAEQGASAVAYANNCFYATKVGYGLGPETLGMIIILRHGSTTLGYNDAMWRKYGRAFAKQMKLEGDDAIRAVGGNPWLVNPADAPPPPKGMEFTGEATLSALAAKGTRFAICELATMGIAMALAGATKGDMKAIQAELIANLIPGGVMVPAGIIAVGHAQDYGYRLAVVE